jgi:hypothetical protein
MEPIEAPVRKRAWQGEEQKRVPNPMIAPLIIENDDKSIFALDYMPTDKEDDLKRRIHESKGILPDNQTIRFNGSQFDIKSIMQMGIKPGMRIQLSVVPCKVPARLSIVQSPKPIIVTVIVITSTAEVMNFRAPPSEPMYNIKVKVCQARGFPVEQQSFIVSGRKLEDHHVVDDYMLSDQTLLLLLKLDKYIHIFVKVDTGRTFLVEVPNDATVDDVKARMGALLDVKDPYEYSLFSPLCGGRVLEGKTGVTCYRDLILELQSPVTVKCEVVDLS